MKFEDKLTLSFWRDKAWLSSISYFSSTMIDKHAFVEVGTSTTTTLALPNVRLAILQSVTLLCPPHFAMPRKSSNKSSQGLTQRSDGNFTHRYLTCIRLWRECDKTYFFPKVVWMAWMVKILGRGIDVRRWQGLLSDKIFAFQTGGRDHLRGFEQWEICALRPSLSHNT